MAPSLCGSLVSSRKSLLSLLWSFVTLLSLGAFVMAALLAARIEGRYRHLAREYDYYRYNDDYYQWYEEHCMEDREEGGGEGRALEEGEGSGEDRDSGDHDSGEDDCRRHDSWEEDPYDDEKWPYSYYPTLAYTSSFAVKFAALYTAALAVALSLYGSLAVVGFSSVRGQYIAPCLGGGSGVDSARRARMRVGAFMGCLVFFSNLCLVIAVVLAEFRVEDYIANQKKQDVDSYAIERISRVMAVLCGFLAVLYGAYALLVFAFKDDIISPDDEVEGMVGGGRRESRRRSEANLELGRIGRSVGGGVTTDGGGVGSDGASRGVPYEPPLVSPGVVGKMQKDSDGFLTSQAATDSY